MLIVPLVAALTGCAPAFSREVWILKINAKGSQMEYRIGYFGKPTTVFLVLWLTNSPKESAPVHLKSPVIHHPLESQRPR